jgi:hypothetical protein
MRRFFGAVLIGLGALLLAVAVGLPLYVAPAVTKLPYNMQACPEDAKAKKPDGCLEPSVAEAKEATFLNNSEGKIEHGTLRSTTWVRPQASLTATEQSNKRLSSNAVIWDVYSNAQWLEDTSGHPVMSAYSTELALDRVSGAAVSSWDGQWLDESNQGGSSPAAKVTYSGQVYKFPFDTQKKDYNIYDSNLRKDLPAKFVEVTTVQNLEAYHFKQVIDRQPLANVTDQDVKTALALFAKTATSGKILYSNIREVWIDPVTGAYVNVREQQTKVLVPNDGTDGETVLLKADFNYTTDTIKNSVKSARDNQSKLTLLNMYAPIGGGILGVLLIAGGIALVGRRGGPAAPAAEAAPWDSNLPQPRHRLRGEGGGPGDTTGVLTDTVPPTGPSWPTTGQG